MPEFGLVGRNIDYSFSRQYFTEKFSKKGLNHTYKNFDIPSIEHFPNLLNAHPELVGINVTIPYKEEIIPYLGALSKNAEKIGAVNTITISRAGKLTGHNTDFYGFQKSLEPLLKNHHQNALILGTGGSSKAVAFALEKLGIQYDFVSRKLNSDSKFVYSDLSTAIISAYNIIINCSPVGTFPNVNACPDIPYEGVGKDHILYDLVYNPPTSKFLICGEVKGAQVINGLEMLKLQAEKAWNLWQKS